MSLTLDSTVLVAIDLTLSHRRKSGYSHSHLSREREIHLFRQFGLESVPCHLGHLRTTKYLLGFERLARPLKGGNCTILTLSDGFGTL